VCRLSLVSAIVAVSRLISTASLLAGRPLYFPSKAQLYQWPASLVSEFLKFATDLVTCHTMGHRVRRRQSDAHGPSLSSGLGPGRCNTDFVSVISAIVTPVSRCSLAAVPLTIKA
jgi:hypothetical protein